MCGVRPVIGPHWDNFKWVGSGLVEQGLVRSGADWQQVSGLLIQDLEKKAMRAAVKKAAWEYVESRQGGTALARRAVQRLLTGVIAEPSPIARDPGKGPAVRRS
jgi:3-deoxy-D-manno-octulosonic-acid transferase